MKTKVEKIVAKEDDPKLASGVVVNGETLPADFVVMGVGVRPATDFLKGSGVVIEKDGGVKVDEYLRVRTGPDTENIYAIGELQPALTASFNWAYTMYLGDIAIYPQLHGSEVRIEHWSVSGVCTWLIYPAF
jgi:pyruvate/2-oxoglutarate dehydrogenase complex dihydrolipoamide dehydrogenase (E3) component